MDNKNEFEQKKLTFSELIKQAAEKKNDADPADVTFEDSGVDIVEQMHLLRKSQMRYQKEIDDQIYFNNLFQTILKPLY